MQPRIKLISHISLIVLSVCLTFFLTVVADRTIGEYLNRSGYFKGVHPDITMIFETNEFRFEATGSAQGLRNEMAAIPKPPGRYRILALGDSFTFGWGVDLGQSWPKLLEKKLQQEGLNIEVINAGVPGIGLMSERFICRAYAKQLNIDAIILGLYYDDLQQSLERSYATSPFRQTLENIWPVFSRINRPVIEGSNYKNLDKNTIIFVDKIWKNKAESLASKQPEILGNLSSSAKNAFLDGKLNPTQIERAYTFPQYFISILDPVYMRYALTSLSIRLEKLKERCTTDYPVMIVFFPASPFVSESYHPGRISLGFEIDPRLTKLNLDVILAPIIKKENYTYESVLSDFRIDGCPDCYYPLDGHFTAYGHYRAVEYLYPKVLQWFKDNSG